MLTKSLLEKIDYISRYANKIYYKDYNRYIFNGETFEDFKNSLILLSLKYPNDSNILLFRRYKYSKLCDKESIPYKIGNMINFSSISNDIELLDKFLGATVEDTCVSDFKILKTIANFLYKDKIYKEKFLDFVAGQSCGSSFNRSIRKKCFKYRFEILDILLDFNYFSYEEYLRYYKIAESLTRYPKVERNLKEDTNSKGCREYYQKNKERIKQKHRQDYSKNKKVS